MALYEVPEKPSDALSYLRNNFVGQNVKELQDTNDTLKAQNAELVISNFIVNFWGLFTPSKTLSGWAVALRDRRRQYIHLLELSAMISLHYSYFCFDVDINTE